MFDTFGDPGPCPVCGAAHSACVGDRDSAGIGTTRGVIVIAVQQLPTRGDVVVAPAGDDDTAAPAEAETTPVRKRRGVRPLRKPAQPAGKT